MKRFLFLIFAVLLIPQLVFAYTSPGQPDGFVNDFAGVLHEQTENELEALLQTYEEQTGHEIVVVLVQAIGDETIETYAENLFREWGIGKQNQDNGALFAAAIADREMRIEVGYGLEGDLTDIEAGYLVKTVVPPYFRSNDYAGGVRAAVVGIKQAIGAQIDTSAAGADAGGGVNFGFVIWIAIFAIMWLASIFARSRSWWAGGVVGAVAGIVLWLFVAGWVWVIILTLGGLLFDYLVSTKYRQMFLNKNGLGQSAALPWLFGGGRHPWDKGGGFGGFGGGMSGGGGASGRW